MNAPYITETSIATLNLKVVESIADLRYYYAELELLGRLVIFKKMENNLGEQLRKDLLLNLKSMLDGLEQEISGSERHLVHGIVENEIMMGIICREEYLSMISVLHRLKRMARGLKLKTIEFLKRAKFNQSGFNRYAILTLPNDVQNQVGNPTKEMSNYRMTRKNMNPIKKYEYER